jgi:hypothetical protein
MLVLGIIVGPAVGLALGRVLAQSQAWRGRGRVAAIAVLALLIAVIPIGDVGLRLGLVAGMVLGALLWITPLPASEGTTPVYPVGPAPRAPTSQETHTL